MSLDIAVFASQLQMPSFFSQINNFGSPLPVKINGTLSRTNSNLPIFWEFVQYVIDSKTSRMDEHWKPTHHYCSLCMINYDYILKFEQLSQEIQDFLEQSRLKQFVSEDVWEIHKNTNRPDQMSRYCSLGIEAIN